MRVWGRGDITSLSVLTGRRRSPQSMGGLATRAADDYFKYPHRLQLYNLPPIDEISLEDFELFAVERLKGEPRSAVDQRRGGTLTRPARRLGPR